MSSEPPTQTRSLHISITPGKPGQVYYPLTLQTTSLPSLLPPNALLLQIHATSLNHRDLFIRQSLYPTPSPTTPLFSDAVATVLSPTSSPFHSRRVLLNPGTGWRSSPTAPESPTGYKIMGGTKQNPLGTGTEYLVMEDEGEGELEECPAHLTDAEAAALPLTGLTAWRAVTEKGRVKAGDKILVTGVGGGVAVMAVKFCVARGAEVWVTSGSREKIARAVEMGAKGGVVYREEGWEKRLMGESGGGGGGGGDFDVVVDGAGGDVVEKGVKLLKAGSIIVSYGMTLGPKMPFSMQAVLKNIELKGSTMGSRKEFHDMVEFVREKQIRPIVSRTVQGIDNIDGINGLFEDMKKGAQFGKLVVEFTRKGSSESKL
ncbi:MAG: hypothetical protein Q9227_001516 [Pyrenula ochraceoflavens]